MNIDFIQKFYELNPSKRHYLYSIALIYPFEKYDDNQGSLSEHIFGQIPAELRESFQM